MHMSIIQIIKRLSNTYSDQPAFQEYVMKNCKILRGLFTTMSDSCLSSQCESHIYAIVPPKRYKGTGKDGYNTLRIKVLLALHHDHQQHQPTAIDFKNEDNSGNGEGMRRPSA